MALWAQMAPQPAAPMAVQAPNAPEQMSMRFAEQPAPAATPWPTSRTAATSYPMPVAPAGWLLSDALIGQPMLWRRRHGRRYYR
jgi:hypothetical protein